MFVALPVTGCDIVTFIFQPSRQMRGNEAAGARDAYLELRARPVRLKRVLCKLRNLRKIARNLIVTHFQVLTGKQVAAPRLASSAEVFVWFKFLTPAVRPTVRAVLPSRRSASSCCQMPWLPARVHATCSNAPRAVQLALACPALPASQSK